MTTATAATAALKLLSSREHTRKELAGKLRVRGFAVDQINDALQQLVEKDLLSDIKFSHLYIRQKQRHFGDWRLRMELSRRGVDENDIQNALQNESRPPENERATKLLLAKYPKDIPAEKATQAQRFLQQRGFSDDIIMPLLSRLTKK